MKLVAWNIKQNRPPYSSDNPNDIVAIYTPPIELEPADKVNDDLYKAWRQYTSWGIPSKKGEEEFTAQYHAFQAGWKCAILKKASEK